MKKAKEIMAMGWPEDSLTPTFPPDVKPEYPGVYMAQPHTQFPRAFSYWDGAHWYMASSSIAQAKRNHSQYDRSVWQNRFWRGLRVEAK